MKTSTCPSCGTESARILQEYDRTFPLPAVRMVRFQCGTCNAEFAQTRCRERRFWDVVKKKLPKRRAYKCPS